MSGPNQIGPSGCEVARPGKIDKMLDDVVSIFVYIAMDNGG